MLAILVLPLIYFKSKFYIYQSYMYIFQYFKFIVQSLTIF